VRPDLPSAFVAAVERALDPDPAKRFASAGEMESALRAVLEAPRPAPRVQPVRRPGLRSRIGFVAVAAALVAVVVGLIVWGRQPAGGAADGGAKAARIAVLPLSNLSASTAAPYLADALTDELISTLGQVGALQVSSLTSTSAYRDKPRTDLPTIGRELGVDHLLEGTVLADAAPGGAPRVRVNVRLLAAGTGATLWTDTFQRELGDTFAIQSEIARAVAEAVGATLTRGESNRLIRQRSTSPAAAEAYLQGRVHLSEYGVSAARRALESFERAIAIDSNHAAAHAGVARAIVRLGLGGELVQADARARSLAAVRAALDLDDLAEAHAAAADIRFFYDWDLPGAEREYLRSLELNPSFNYARTYYAQLLSALQRHDEARRQVEEARRLDPQSGEAVRMQALIHYYARAYRDAADVLEQALLMQPDAAGTYLLLGRVAEAEGRYADALELTTRAADLSDGGGVPLRVNLVRLEALNGRRDQAQKALEALLGEASERRIHVSARDLGYVQLGLGHVEEALAAFERSLEERDPSLVWLGVDPRCDELRQHPRFRAILQTIGLL
jgi:TolB-like protein/tetratricopeptide (TPR) repeat protein